MIIRFKGEEIDVPKKVKVIVDGEVIQYFDLAYKEEMIRIKENSGVVCFEVAYEQTKRNKWIGVIIFFISLLGSVGGDEIIQALYIDTLKFKNLKQDIEVKYHRKNPLFSVKQAVDYEIQRKVKKSDYLVAFFMFFLPTILLFSTLFFGFMTFDTPLLLKVLICVILGGLDIYLIYLATTLYLKTK